MNLAMSAGFLTVTVLLYSLAYGAFRNENSRIQNSSMSDTVAVAASIILTGLIALTLALVIAAGVRIDETIADLDAIKLAVIAACAALCWFLPKRILAHVGSPSGTAPEGTVASFPGGRNSKKPSGSGTVKHRKAA